LLMRLLSAPLQLPPPLLLLLPTRRSG